MLTVNTDDAVRDIKKFLEPLTSQQARTAVSRSINEALVTGRVQLVREIANVYTIKPSLARQQLNNIKANSMKLVGQIAAVSRRHSMSDFKNSKYDAASNSMRSIVSQRKENGKLGKALKVRSLTGKSMRVKDKKKFTRLLIEIKKGQSKSIGSAFLMQSKGGVIWAGRGTYNSQYNFAWRDKRVSKTGNDLPANKLLTPSIYATAVNNAVQRKAEPIITDRYMQRLMHNLTAGVTHRGKYA